jgi:hypothetical protein
MANRASGRTLLLVGSIGGLRYLAPSLLLKGV